MKKQKLNFPSVVQFSLGQNIYYEKRKSTFNLFQIARRFLSTILYAKTR